MRCGTVRGGVPVAEEVARKIGAPGYSELAIGAVTAFGGRYLNRPLIDQRGISEAELENLSSKKAEEARERELRFRGTASPLDIAGRVVIVVDDGLATGATMHAAVDWVRAGQPRRLVVAVPVGSRETCHELSELADEGADETSALRTACQKRASNDGSTRHASREAGASRAHSHDRRARLG